MAIFIDRSGHLYSDHSLRELYDFAVVSLKLNHYWNHLSSNRIPHFDITSSKIEKLTLSMGAIKIDSNESQIESFKRLKRAIPFESYSDFIFDSTGLKNQPIKRINLLSFLRGRNIFFAGIGSRKTPPEVIKLMTQISKGFCGLGLILRSGGASGADSAFELGAQDGFKEIFRPGDATLKSIELAKKFHPAPDALNGFSEKLMGRNMQIVSGRDLSSDVDFVICWTPRGAEIGGTAQAIRYAKSKNIPVFNLYNSKDLIQLREIYMGISKNVTLLSS